MTVVSPSPSSSSAQLKKPLPTRMEVAASFGRDGLELILLELASLRSRDDVDDEACEGDACPRDEGDLS